MQALKQWLEVSPGARPKSNFAQIVSAIVGIGALLGIYVQVSLARTNALQASARQVYMAYSETGLKYPELSQPDYAVIKASGDKKQLSRYKAYVSQMLWAYDEILSIEAQPEWIATFEYDLREHLDYLCEENDPLFYAMFYKTMREALAKEKSIHCKQPAAHTQG
jgi:hypothetical protein